MRSIVSKYVGFPFFFNLLSHLLRVLGLVSDHREFYSIVSCCLVTVRINSSNRSCFVYHSFCILLPAASLELVSWALEASG